MIAEIANGDEIVIEDATVTEIAEESATEK
jgi:hypothetical protein